MQIAGVEIPDFALDRLREFELDEYEGPSIGGILQTTVGEGSNAITIDWLPKIPHDIFYRAEKTNILEYLGKSKEETEAKIADFISIAGDMALMKMPLGDGTSHKRYVKGIEFEIYDDGSDPVAMIMAPVGHTGTMLNIALATQTAIEQGTCDPVVVTSGGDIVPPMPGSFDEKIGGVALLTGAQSQGENAAFEPSNTGNIGEIEKPHFWLQYMLPGDSKDIIPGEFVGIACQPWLPHCWWYQGTSPFLYAGHWMETRFYTSGVVKSKVEIDPDPDPPYTIYTVWVKNEEIAVKATDYYGYEVGDRVGLLKALTEPCLFSDKDMGAMGAMGAMGGDAWRLIPVDFYGATP